MRNQSIYGLLFLLLSSTAYSDNTSYVIAMESSPQQPQEMSEILYNYSKPLHSDIIPEYSKEELELDKLLDTINHTTTQSGTYGLSYLMQPKKDMTSISTLRESIISLLEHPEAREQIRSALHDIRESEAYLASYFETESEQAEALGHDLYYDTLGYYFPSLNYSPTALGVGMHFGPSLKILTSTFGLFAPTWISQAQSYTERIFTTWGNEGLALRDVVPTYRECGEAITNGTRIYFQQKTPFSNTLADPSRFERFQQGMNSDDPAAFTQALSMYTGQDYARPTSPSVGDSYLLWSHLTGYTSVGVIIAASNYGWELFLGTSIYGNYKELSRRHKTADQLHTIVSHVSRIIQRARDINQIVATYIPADIYHELPQSQFVTQTPYIDTSSEQLDSLLTSQTFAEQTRSSHRAPHLRKQRKRYSTGKVLTAHQLITDQPETLLSTMQYIGTIDALVGLADMYETHANMPNQYCFVSFDTDRTTPYVELENFWTPLMSADKAVGNDITLDTTNAIFTGPNGIGKSTAMKGIAHSIIMAQSVGIAPANKADQSLFDYINTYLNIREDSQEGLSTFMAEKKRIDSFYNEAPHLTGNTLYLVDEPFRGTFAEEAEKRVTNFGEFIDQHPNVMMLMATHFEKPTTLDHEHRYANYHIGIDECTDGTFYLTYRVHPGTLDWWFTNPEKRSRFVDWISDHMAEKAAR